MKKRTLLLIVPLFLALVVLVAAQTGNGFDLSWWSVDGGGGGSSGDDYALEGAIGQPDAGTARGGDYSLEGGLWPDAEPETWSTEIYLPLIVRP